MNIKSEVYCTLQIEGTHNWPGCPFDEVAYLRDPHRHVFHIKAHKLVNHDDRDTEFIMMKHQITEYLFDKYLRNSKDPTSRITQRLHAFGAMSCEMLARELIEEFDLCQCEVNEDNENGAILYVE